MKVSFRVPSKNGATYYAFEMTTPPPVGAPFFVSRATVVGLAVESVEWNIVQHYDYEAQEWSEAELTADVVLAVTT